MNIQMAGWNIRMALIHLKWALLELVGISRRTTESLSGEPAPRPNGSGSVSG